MKTSSSAKSICCNNELCGSLLCILEGACQSLSLVACQAVVGCLPGSLGEAGSSLVANDVIGWQAARLPSHPHPSG